MDYANLFDIINNMRALIVGISGQDGIILSNLLRSKGYEVFGTQIKLDKKVNEVSFPRVRKNEAQISEIDLSSPDICSEFLNSVKPDIIYHLAAVHGSSSNMNFIENNDSDKMIKCHVDLTKNLLDWQILNNKSRLCLALTSQMYSPTAEISQIDLNSEFNPQNFYAKTKLQGFNTLKYYRQKYNLFSIGLILFNHTSIYAKNDFLFKLLAKQIIDFSNKSQPNIVIRDANQKIDISDAFEVCDAIYRAGGHEFARDFIISSGKVKSIMEIILEACYLLNIKIKEGDIISTQPSINSSYQSGNTDDVLQNLNWRAIKGPSEILVDMISFESKLKK